MFFASLNAVTDRVTAIDGSAAESVLTRVMEWNIIYCLDSDGYDADIVVWGKVVGSVVQDVLIDLVDFVVRVSDKRQQCKALVCIAFLVMVMVVDSRVVVVNGRGRFEMEIRCSGISTFEGIVVQDSIQ